jgi:acylpyruvate hydrolase
MRWITFQIESAVRFGLEHGSYFVDLGVASRSLGPGEHGVGEAAFGRSLAEMLRLGPTAIEAARKVELAIEEHERSRGLDALAVPGGGFFPAAAARRLAPIPRPGKIVCVGRNYADHCAEQGRPLPEKPLFFTKPATSVIADGDPIDSHPDVTRECDYEAELAVVIGKEGRSIPEDRAWEHVAGYTIVNDVTARDLQRADPQWTRAKGLDTFCPMGPCIVTKDRIPDPHGLEIRCFVNGELRQSSNTRHLVFRVPELVSRLSQGLTLEPGDVISTGTPGGVGAYLDPPRFLKGGDEIRIELEGIGTLTNVVRGTS